MADHQLLRARARIERLLQDGTELQLKPRDGHARRMTGTCDEYDGGKSHENENEKGFELHGHIENLAKLRESALSLRHSAIEDVVARQKRDGDEDDG